MDRLTVYCILWGDKYSPEYVYALKEMVEKNLTVEHDFRCITTRRLDGIVTINPFVPYSGWWQKIGLFAPTIAMGPSLYFDLDIVITGNIDYLVEFTKYKIAAPANWARSGHGGLQSSVMAWRGNWHLPYRMFDYQKDSKRFYGDQEFLWDLMGDDWVRIPHIGSYKYHCVDGLPDDLKIIVFHGKPDPHEVNDKWLSPYILTHYNRINKNMHNG